MRYYLLIIIPLLVAAAGFMLAAPSQSREWATEQALLPSAQIEGKEITVHNIRNFTYASASEFTPAYYDRTFDLNKLERVWYAVVPFSGVPGSAHTFLSFEFEDGQFLAVSVEARRERGEPYNSIKGLFRKYELIYVLADERDVIRLRTHHHKNSVYLYPAAAEREQVQKLFVGIMARVNELAAKPEFYNTIFNSCTTNIVEHINELTPHRVPLFSLRILFPANSDKLAHELGLLDTNLSLNEAREKFLINARSLKYGNDPNYSQKIRLED